MSSLYGIDLSSGGSFQNQTNVTGTDVGALAGANATILNTSAGTIAATGTIFTSGAAAA